MHQREGSFLNWEGRLRSFQAVINEPTVMSDLRVLAALADGFGVDLGFRTAAQARAELEELGRWEGDRAPAPDFDPGQVSRPEDGQAVLATWRLSLDDSRALDGEPNLRATIRPPVARVGPRSAEALGSEVAISTDRGSLRFPVVVEPTMVEGVVWVPSRAPGEVGRRRIGGRGRRTWSPCEPLGLEVTP